MRPWPFIQAATNILLTRRWPASLVHFVTNRCNARCPHCFMDFQNIDDAHALSLEEIDQVTRHTGPALRNVNLTGGEPFLHPDLTNIARCYYRNAGVESIFITSNGSHPDRVQRLATTLATEFPDRKLILAFSIDNLRDDHDRTRQIPGLFDKALQSYHAARRAGPSVMACIGITISESNGEHVDELYEHLIEEQGVRAINVGPVRTQGCYRIPASRAQAIHQRYFALHERLCADMRSGRVEGFDAAHLSGRLLNRKNDILFRNLRQYLTTDAFIIPCQAGALFGVIAADGEVHPCETLSESYGNLRAHHYDLTQIWRSPNAVASRRRIKATKCRCAYECAATLSILGCWRHQPELLRAALTRPP